MVSTPKTAGFGKLNPSILLCGVLCFFFRSLFGVLFHGGARERSLGGGKKRRGGGGGG